jgi:hypothetical protein
VQPILDVVEENKSENSAGKSTSRKPLLKSSGNFLDSMSKNRSKKRTGKDEDYFSPDIKESSENGFGIIKVVAQKVAKYLGISHEFNIVPKHKSHNDINNTNRIMKNRTSNFAEDTKGEF